MAQQSPKTPRDQAVAIASYFLSKLFVWVHLPWTATEAQLAATLVDRIIAAAADAARTDGDGAALLSELLTEPPQRPANRYQTVQTTREALLAEDDPGPEYREWQRRRQGSDDRASVGRMLRSDDERRR